MKSFWSYITNGEYYVGCTGQTTIVYDKDERELAQFKGLRYAYHPIISPDGDTLVVKTTEGRLAVYSLSELKLLKKFRFSSVDGCQDDGYCFSGDGKLFFNLERQNNSLESAISVYDAKNDFSRIRHIMLPKDKALCEIEYDEESGLYYVLWFSRDDIGVAEKYFVSSFDGENFVDDKEISIREYEFYRNYIDLKRSGFTVKRYLYSYIDFPLEQLERNNFSLPRFYRMK